MFLEENSFIKYLVACVIIIDNASSDDSLAHVESLQNLPFKLQIIRNINNQGFGAACNQGAALAVSEYLLFLNPDTLLFENSMPATLLFMQDEKNRDVGIVGIQLLDAHGKISRSCARFPTLRMFVAQSLGLNRMLGLRHLSTNMADWTHDETKAVDHVIGAFYLIRSSVFHSLGGFDERFFVYLEDLDMSLRANQAGWRSVYLADVQAFHLGGGTSTKVKTARLFYSLRSRLHYGFKHFSFSKAWLLVFFTCIVEPWSRLTFSLLKGAWCYIKNTFKAYILLIKSLPELIIFQRR